MPPSEQPTGETLQRFLAPLTAEVNATAQPDNEPWSGTIERISNADRIAEITEETWWYFLEVLPPKLLEGNWFAFAEGQEALRIFFQRRGKHYCRQLTEEQSMRVCELTGLPKEYGAY